MNYRRWGWVLKPAVVLAVLATNVTLPRFPVAAPEQEPLSTAALPEVSSLADLYHLRDRLRAELARRPAVRVATRSGLGIVPAATLDQLAVIDRRLRQEEQARRLWQRAEELAAAAIAQGDPAAQSPETLVVAYTVWGKALAALDQIPADTFWAHQSVAQRQKYDQQRAIVAYHYDTARSGFLAPIVAAAVPAARVRLTVCNLQRECRRWQGNQPPASPASLIKVPMAIALMTHLQQSGIDPAEPIWVDPSNWTEDAGTTWVGTAYPLEQVMADMISASSNIATNQLIDYLGWDKINQTLHHRGYRATAVRTKLVGESTYPANPGQGPNRLTTDELTDMMVAIYNQEIPNAALIQAALANQRDRNLGYTAVRPPLTWLGEKTGRNSKVLGTTTAVDVSGQRYIITATLDHSAHEAAMRSIVTGVLQYLLTHNGFGDAPEGSDAPNAIALSAQTSLP